MADMGRGPPGCTAATNLWAVKFPHLVAKRFIYFPKRSKRDYIKNIADIGYPALFIVFYCMKIIIDISFILDFPKKKTFSIRYFVKKYVFYVLQEHESDIN